MLRAAFTGLTASTRKCAWRSARAKAASISARVAKDGARVLATGGLRIKPSDRRAGLLLAERLYDRICARAGRSRPQRSPEGSAR
jgi:hypothetical protein